MNDTFLNSANAPYVAELYSKFRNDPESVDITWKDFFNNLNEDDYSVLKALINLNALIESKVETLNSSEL